jgi:hypothetical protein
MVIRPSRSILLVKGGKAGSRRVVVADRRLPRLRRVPPSASPDGSSAGRRRRTRLGGVGHGEKQYHRASAPGPAQVEIVSPGLAASLVAQAQLRLFFDRSSPLI